MVQIALAGLVALAVAMGIGRFAFTPILPMMQQDAGVSVGEGGWLASANYLGYLVGALSSVILGVHSAIAIRTGLLIVGVTTLGMGLTQSVAAWLVLRALAGLGSAWVLIFASAWALGKLSTARRPVLRGTVFAGVGIGITVAGVSCVALMQWRVGSPEAWQALGIIALVATMAVWRTFRNDHDQRGDPNRQHASVQGYGWNVDSVCLVLCYGSFGFGYIIPATFVPAMARDFVKDPLVFGWSWPIFGAAAAVSTLIAGSRIPLVGNRRLWAASHFVMALGVVAPVVWPTIGGIIVAALLVGATFMVNTMSGMQEAQIVGGPHAMSLMGVMTVAFATGQIGAPLVVTATIGPDGDFSRALLIASLVLVLSAGILTRGRPGVYAESAKVDGNRPP